MNVLKSCINTCHNYLYSNGAICGNDASNDIIKIFILKVISYLYSNDDNKKIILNKIEKLKTDENYDRYLTYLDNFTEITKTKETDDFSHETHGFEMENPVDS
jgi:hypothetical protein